MTAYLREDFRALLDSGALGPTLDVFEALANVEGITYRKAPGRRTMRLTIGDAAFFVKQHTGVGWREIAKCWLSLKRPVLGARNEYVACRRLSARGVAAPRVAAFGERGRNPAARRSFVVCDAFEGFVSLEDLAAVWAAAPPPPALKRQLVTAVGELTRAMHGAGVQHRDFYLCHLLVDEAKLAAGEVVLAVIDLHRARTRARTSRTGRLKDLAALLYSSAALAPSTADRLRFVAAYAAARPAVSVRRERRYWRGVERRAERLRIRARNKGLAIHPPPATAVTEKATTVGSLADLHADVPMPVRFDADLGTGGQRVLVKKVLRLEPRRHLVLQATIDEHDVLVKAFFGWRATARCRREQRGLQSLAAAGVATPPIRGIGRGGGATVLVRAHWEGGRTPRACDIALLLAVLARLHEHGLRLRDARAAEFVVREGRLCAVGMGGIRQRRWPAVTRIGRRASRRDMAGLLAWLSATAEPLPAAAWQGYCTGRSLAFGDADRDTVVKRADGIRRRQAER